MRPSNRGLDCALIQRQSSCILERFWFTGVRRFLSCALQGHLKNPIFEILKTNLLHVIVIKRKTWHCVADSFSGTEYRHKLQKILIIIYLLVNWSIGNNWIKRAVGNRITTRSYTGQFPYIKLILRTAFANLLYDLLCRTNWLPCSKLAAYVQHRDLLPAYCRLWPTCIPRIFIFCLYFGDIGVFSAIWRQMFFFGNLLRSVDQSSRSVSYSSQAKKACIVKLLHGNIWKNAKIMELKTFDSVSHLKRGSRLCITFCDWEN